MLAQWVDRDNVADQAAFVRHLLEDMDNLIWAIKSGSKNRGVKSSGTQNRAACMNLLENTASILDQIESANKEVPGVWLEYAQEYVKSIERSVTGCLVDDSALAYGYLLGEAQTALQEATNATQTLIDCNDEFVREEDRQFSPEYC